MRSPDWTSKWLLEANYREISMEEMADLDPIFIDDGTGATYFQTRDSTYWDLVKSK